MANDAGKIRVLIPTTRGPVEVLLLTEEDPAIGRCVACIGGTTEAADIAAAYHAFVVRPTGVVESLFGHSCYRLDISGRIDAGSSWQLGVLAAHALHSAGRLAQENDPADGVIWATGSVRPVDLTVGAVSHVPEKIANSTIRLQQEAAAGRRVHPDNCGPERGRPFGSCEDRAFDSRDRDCRARTRPKLVRGPGSEGARATQNIREDVGGFCADGPDNAGRTAATSSLVSPTRPVDGMRLRLGRADMPG